MLIFETENKFFMAEIRTVDHPLATIRYGINVSSNGDSVLVAAGTYTENVNYNGKNIVIQGADRETTIIDGNQIGCVVTFENGEGSGAILSGFTITNGSGTGSPNYSGGGITCINNSSPILNNLIINSKKPYT